MKTNKTSTECAKYNTANAEAIATGLVESWEPDDRTAAVEAEEARHAAIRARFDEAAANLFRNAWAALSADAKAAYGPPVVERRGNTHFIDTSHLFLGNPRIIAVNRGKAYFFRLEVTVDCLTEWVKLSAADSPVSATLEQLHKCTALMEAAYVSAEGARRQHVLRQEASDRKEKLAAGDAGFLRELQNHINYEFTVQPDGRVTCGYKTYTVGQWKALLALKADHRAALAALEASFAKGGAK